MTHGKIIQQLIELLNRDHHPSDAEEKARIEAAGGEIHSDNTDTLRVQGRLNMTRSIGKRKVTFRHFLAKESQNVSVSALKFSSIVLLVHNPLSYCIPR